MKKLSLVVVLLTLAITTFAQEKDVTKFLGIPVDGTKTEMIAKLKEKGFTTTSWDKDVLEGEFNGTDVYVSVVTNNNKVYRVMVRYKDYRSEADIKNRYNNLCHQFENNTKYLALLDYSISEEEDISYNITVNDKQYQAAFYQVDIDKVIEKILEKYNIEDVKNANEDLKTEITKTAFEMSSHKLVWFMIVDSYGEYAIAMYYDNVLNQANGDDL